MLPQRDDPPTDQATGDSSTPSDNILHPSHHQQQERLHTPTSPTSTTPLVKAVTTTLSPLEDIPLTFCNRPPLSFRFPSPGSPGSEHDETIIRMVDDEQSWGDIEALAGEEAFDRYYSFLDPSLEEFWTQDKIEQLNNAVIDHVGRFLKPRAAAILKGTQHHHQQWHSKNSNTNGDNDSEREDVKKVTTIYPIVVMPAWMDLSRWEKVARSVSSSPLVCQHIWETFGDGRLFTKEELPFLNEIKAAAIESGARITVIKDATARVEAAKTKAAQQEAERLEAQRIEAAKIKAAKREEERIEAAGIKAAQDEADRIKAKRLEAERIIAAETQAKRVKANKIRAMKRRANADAAKEGPEKEPKVRKVAKKKKSGESRAATELSTRQHFIFLQENIAREDTAREDAAREDAAREGHAKQGGARAEVTRRQTVKEVNEDALATSKAKRETALAAAKAWEIAVRGMAARKAEILSVATKRQRNVSRGQVGLDRDQDLPLSSGDTLGSKCKISNMGPLFPPATFNFTTTVADQENRPPEQDTIFPPSTLRSSASSTPCSSLISPAPSPLDESLDFQYSKRTRHCSSPENLSGPTVTSTETKTTTPTSTTAIKSTTTNATPSPVPLLSDDRNTTPKTPSLTLPSLPSTSLLQDTESQERIQKLRAMKKVLTDSTQSMELLHQNQRVETDMLLRQRDAAIEAAKARQRGDSNNTSSHLENNRTKSSQDPSEGRIPASFNAPEESIPVLTGLPSPVTPNQLPVSPSSELPAAAPKTASLPVIDLREDADRGLSIATSATQQQPPPQQDHLPQQLLPFQPQQQNSQQIPQAQQHRRQQQYLVQQHLQQDQQQPPCLQQQQQQQQQQPILQHPQPTRSLSRPAQPVQSSSPQVSVNHQQMQEFLKEQFRKSPDLHKVRQRHVFEKEQLLEQRQLDTQRLVEQQLVTAQLPVNQRHSNEQLRLAAVNMWRQREQVWQKRVQEIRQKEHVLDLKLASLRQQNQQLRQAIFSEHKQWQQQPAVTPERIKQLHTNQRMQLATSQQQRYTTLQSVPVAQQAQAMANLRRLCGAEAQVLMAQQKDVEEKVDRFWHHQEESKKTVLWLQRQLHQVQETERAFRKLLEGLHAQKLEQERQHVVLLQEHQVLQQGLQMVPAPSSSSLPQGLMAGQGIALVNLATSQQQQDQLLKEKYVMDERLRQQLSHQRDIRRKLQLQEQVDLQQAQISALLQQARTIAKVRPQRLTQTTSQGQLGQPWPGVQAQARQQQQAQTITAQEQQIINDGPAAQVFPTFPNPFNQPGATKPISLPLQPAPVVQDPPRPRPVSPPLQALVTAQPQQPTPTSQRSQLSTSGTTPTSAPPTIQQQQPSLELITTASKLPAIFPFPNPLYDITEWTAEDKNRLWATWLEVGDDWEQISTKGLRGKFSVEACRAVILGTAS